MKFFQQNLDKFIGVGLFLMLLYFFLSHPENKTLENITWLAFGAVLTLLGVKATPQQTIDVNKIENADISAKDTEKIE